ncbi:MAG: anthranilate synthase component I [Methylacidiphilales bacterium]|nr:anthranilate synthase component I [Candidatus Methylacidiphilales bacterium]MDW8349441.1 anthranilate synthase component I [Verrucomicrobiae bacterium]
MSEITPTIGEFNHWAEQGNVIPIQKTLAADWITPLAAYEKLAKDNRYAFILESVERGHRFARYSIIGAGPCVVMMARDGIEEWIWADGRCERREVKDPLRSLEGHMRRYVIPKGMPSLPFFCGGAIGFLAYEAGCVFEPVVPRAREDDLGVPDFYFIICDEVVVFDHEKHVIHIVVNVHLSAERDFSRVYTDAVGRIGIIESVLCEAHEINPIPMGLVGEAIESSVNMTRDYYCQMVARMQRYIEAGDIFQVVPSQRWCVAYDHDPILLYRALRAINPSPYMFCLKFDSLALVGSSPEVHVRCVQGRATIRPIAGTRPRHEDAERDRAIAEELLADEKERAEHLMLVDLARNDLGRVCRYDTVHVTDFMVIERYSHVMHIVSNVEGRLREDVTPYDVLRATFPAGTVTGAPKIRAMQIIAENEPTCRGTYAGAVGYFSYAGNLDSCIAIRTWLIKDGKAYLQAGGGLVADSTPEGEYLESCNKAQAGLKAMSWAVALSKRKIRAGSIVQ